MKLNILQPLLGKENQLYYIQGSNLIDSSYQTSPWIHLEEHRAEQFYFCHVKYSFTFTFECRMSFRKVLSIRKLMIQIFISKEFYFSKLYLESTILSRSRAMWNYSQEVTPLSSQYCTNFGDFYTLLP